MIKTTQLKIQPKAGKNLIYVCGPYRNTSEEKKKENIWHALRVSVRLWELGFFVICPHLNTANFEFYTNLDNNVWLDGGLEMLRRCDCVFILKGFETSPGSLKECELAQKLGKDIYFEDSS